jgi:uncharacterized protein YegP (UPF0339 family)
MPAAYVLKRSADAQFFFILTAENNETILTSETYRNRSGAEKGIESVRQNSPRAERFERKTSADGKWYFNLVAANGERIGRSETYSSSGAMENGIASVMKNGPNAPLRDAT